MVKINELIYSNRKTIQLQINNRGELVVRAPNKCPIKTIERFISQKEGWIIANQAKIHAREEKNSAIYDNFQIYLLGNIYDIVVCDIKHITFEESICKFPSQFCDKFSHFVMLHYKKLAKQFLPQRVEHFSAIIGQTPSKLRLSNTKGSWGACNGRREVSLNWRLMMVGEELIDYVVVHELSHLLQMNHSSKFWKIVESVLPNYKVARMKLKRNDYLLNLYR